MTKFKTFSFLFLLLPSAAQCFTLYANVSIQFDTDEVKVFTLDDGSNACANAGFTEDDLETYVKAAVKVWNKIPTSSLKLEAAGKFDPGNTDFTTGELCLWDSVYPPASCASATKVPQVSHIYVGCSTNANDNENFPSNDVYSTNILASTSINNISGRNIIGSVILLNAADPAVAIAALNDEEIIATIAHEMGHAIGLGHSEKSYALMHASLIGKKNNLSEDDVQGVTYLYPVKLDGCGMLATIQDINSNNDSQGPGSFFFNMILGFLICVVLKLRPKFLA
ncbi:MAG: matrixin family metalloprotease [Bacteriovoracaceae bacterium]|nr:matrixin family metalloprotease [Bacteriovoracaceae bacterium]